MYPSEDEDLSTFKSSITCERLQADKSFELLLTHTGNT